jgi:hypothetical protein
MNRTHWKRAFCTLAAWVSAAGAASCLSGDEAPAVVRVEYPPGHAPIPVAFTEGAQGMSPLPPKEPFTPLDRALAEDCPARAWSHNVPDRDCTSDGECGDGFCDRGHCDAISTCWVYGRRCVNGRTVPSSHQPEGNRCICLDGRCQSCRSDVECEEVYGKGSGCGLWLRGGLGGLRGCGWPALTRNRPIQSP